MSVICICMFKKIKFFIRSVAIKRYMRLLWATVVGMCRFYLWLTVGGLRLPGCRVTPWGFAPDGDMWSWAVSLVFDVVDVYVHMWEMLSSGD